MPPSISIASLLNPVPAPTNEQLTPGLVDIQPYLRALSEFSGSGSPAVATPVVRDALAQVVHNLTSSPPSSTPTISPPRSPHRPVTPPHNPPQYNVTLNRVTTLSVLYSHALGDFVEYPETGNDFGSSVGHLFEVDPLNWHNPIRNIAYSLGGPSGRTQKGNHLFCRLLVDKDDSTITVPCIERHYTCQGSKVCPYTIKAEVSKIHTSANREILRERLHLDQENRMQGASPTRDIFQKTAAFITALRKVGCGAPAHEPTSIPLDEQVQRSQAEQHQIKLQRGYKPKLETCKGQILFEYDHNGNPFIRCEHYQKRVNRDHLVNYNIRDGSYDTNYIAAILKNDTDGVINIEEGALAAGYGPLAVCQTVANFSSQRLFCSSDHRNEEDVLIQAEMYHLTCAAKFRIYEPLEEYRTACPHVLVVINGPHSHPIPLPKHTPPLIRAEIFQLLETLNEDLPDITPRSLLRHPNVQSYLQAKLPAINSPTLSDVHISLANRSHLKTYIDQVTAKRFPDGTGWEEIHHLKCIQDQELSPTEQYIRAIIEMDLSTITRHEEDDWDGAQPGDQLRMVICMSKQGSQRLLRAQYIQSDIGFKRVVGFYEFELAAMDRDANTSIVFCWIYLNCQSAAAHQQIFREIEKIVKADTGQSLRWRHLHALSINDFDGSILHWAVDQHGGQAKGLGLHLQDLALEQPDKFDLHEPERKLISLSPYDHLHRLLRLCTIHAKRNIRKCAVSDEVKNLMCSLICMEHTDWDGTLGAIAEKGGKVGMDWVQDKLRSKFAFEGMCWQKSFIPKLIWMAGDATSNVVESAHENAQLEGLHCSLVGGVEKGRCFDMMREKTLKAFEDAGVRPSYQSGHLSENAIKNLKRKNVFHHNNLMAEDSKIEKHNERMRKADSALQKAQHKVLQLRTSGHNTQQCQRAEQAEGKAQASFDQIVKQGQLLAETGSGKVPILLPSGLLQRST